MRGSYFAGGFASAIAAASQGNGEAINAKIPISGGINVGFRPERNGTISKRQLTPVRA